MSTVRTSVENGSIPNRNHKLNDTVTELKNTLESFNNRLDEAEERIFCHLKTRQWNSANQSSKKKDK